MVCSLICDNHIGNSLVCRKPREAYGNTSFKGLAHNKFYKRHKISLGWMITMKVMCTKIVGVVFTH